MTNLELSILRAELATKPIHAQLAQKAIDTYLSEAIRRGLIIEESPYTTQDEALLDNNMLYI